MRILLVDCFNPVNLLKVLFIALSIRFLLLSAFSNIYSGPKNSTQGAINITRKEEEPVKVMKWIPKRFVNYCNLINNEYPKCELSRITIDHLKEVHGIRVPTPIEMISLIEEKWKPGITREKMMILAENLVEIEIFKIQHKLYV